MALTATEKKIVKKASRTEKGGWIHIHIEGSPYEMGFQHGWLLNKEIREAIRVNEFTTEWGTGMSFDSLSVTFMEMVIRSVPDEYMDELQGIVDGCARAGYELSLSTLFGWNSMCELLGNWYPYHAGGGSLVPSVFSKEGHCSAFMATGKTTKTGEIVMGHNSWINYMNGMSLNVIIDYAPDSGNRMLLQTWAGHLDSGTDFFVTEAGIMGLETSINGLVGYDENGIPEFIRARKAMQYSESIEQWMNTMINNSTGGYGNTWMLGNMHTNEIYQFDNGVTHNGVNKTDSGYFGGFNIAENLQVRNIDTVSASKYYDITDEASRRVRWMHFLSEKNPKGSLYGKVDIANAKKMIGDHGDVFEGRLEGKPFKKDNPSSRTLCGHIELDNSLHGRHGDAPAFYPSGANDGKVMDASMAKKMSFEARWGHPCGTPFNANEFLALNPQYEYMRGYLFDRPANDWVKFAAKK